MQRMKSEKVFDPYDCGSMEISTVEDGAVDFLTI